MREEIKEVFTGLANNVPSKIPHPYYPLEVEIVGYLANEWSVPLLLGVFFSGCAVLAVFTHVCATKQNPHLRKSEITTIMWFVLCAFPLMLAPLKLSWLLSDTEHMADL